MVLFSARFCAHLAGGGKTTTGVEELKQQLSMQAQMALMRLKSSRHDKSMKTPLKCSETIY